ncbi:MAG: ClbS/DfsB family four-helix bundle protein [Nocardioides sp.]
MSRFTSKQQLLDEIVTERAKLDVLLARIPDSAKDEAVVDGLTVKDLLAHRTEWARMTLSWYETAKAGGAPAVPSATYKWNQLPALNAEIRARFANASLDEIEGEYTRVHDLLLDTVTAMSEEELLTPHYYAFTGSTDLAAYVNGASAAHYRSARKCIAKWWKAR